MLRRAAHQGEHHVLAALEVERLLHVDPLHGAHVRAVGAVGERFLIHDRRAVDEPLDHGDVAPGRRGIVEDVVILRHACNQIAQHLIARLAEVLRHAIEHLAVADFVLDLGRQCELAAQTRGPCDPLPFGQRTNDLGVGVMLRHLEHAGAIGLRQPIVRLDELAGIDLRLELGELLGVLLHVVIDVHAYVGASRHEWDPSEIDSTQRHRGHREGQR